VNEQATVSLMENRRNLWESAETPESHIQVTHENLASSDLTRLVKLVSALDVGIGGE